jgi:hypothetical protein
VLATLAAVCGLFGIVLVIVVLTAIDSYGSNK